MTKTHTGPLLAVTRARWHDRRGDRTLALGGRGAPSRGAAGPAPRRAAFGLACAEHLVALHDSPRQVLLREALEVGWQALLGSPSDVTSQLIGLEARDDLDDDEVAAVSHALDGVLGSAQPPGWAADRSRDAAYERLDDRSHPGTFPLIEVDTTDPIVQEELVWQLAALTLAESDQPLPQLVAGLRS